MDPGALCRSATGAAWRNLRPYPISLYMSRNLSHNFGMPTSISIIGASGAVGGMLAVHLLRGGLLKSADRLPLVGHGIASSSAQLLSNRIDLMDAFDDEGVDVEVVANIEDVDGDIVPPVLRSATRSESGNEVRA
jgi:hypothetical protein